MFAFIFVRLPDKHIHSEHTKQNSEIKTLRNPHYHSLSRKLFWTFKCRSQKSFPRPWNYLVKSLGFIHASRCRYMYIRHFPAFQLTNSLIALLNLLLGIPLSFYLAAYSSQPRLTFMVVNVLFIAALALWLQKDMWKTMAVCACPSTAFSTFQWLTEDRPGW
jgi:hypothetical protein